MVQQHDEESPDSVYDDLFEESQIHRVNKHCESCFYEFMLTIYFCATKFGVIPDIREFVIKGRELYISLFDRCHMHAHPDRENAFESYCLNCSIVFSTTVSDFLNQFGFNGDIDVAVPLGQLYRDVTQDWYTCPNGCMDELEDA